MKRALQANINNKVFYIDEDAYNLLQNYLRQLSDAFSGPEGKEIVDDIECRASELLSERVENGKNVIDIQCIYQVIETIGSPEELGAQAGTQYPDADDNTPPPPYKQMKNLKKLYRDPNDRVLGGVVGGLAKYLGWNAGVMRLLLVVLALTTYVMPMVLCYLIAWMVIPLANTPRKKLEMEGREVTFDSVAQSLRDSAQEQLRKIDSANVGHTATSLFGAACKVVGALIILAGSVIGISALIGLFVAIFFLINHSMGSSWFIYHFDPYTMGNIPVSCIWGACICLIAAILSALLIGGVGAVAFNWKRISKTLLFISGLALVILITALIILTIFFINHHTQPFFL